MNPLYVIMVNGYPESGKDTFVEFCNDSYINHSTVDTIKRIATEMGWSGNKTKYNRDMLSALKDFYGEWFDGPFQEIKSLVLQELTYGDVKVDFIFVHAREPEEIERVKVWCDSVEGVKCYTVFIKRDEVMGGMHNNHADAQVEDYIYDCYLNNNLDLEHFENLSLDFFEDVLNGKMEEYNDY